MKLSKFFGTNYEHSEVEDLHLKIKAIQIAEALSGAEIDTLKRAYKEGLMESGDTPSKSGRGLLLSKGVLCQTCFCGNDYTFSVTYPFGYEVLQALEAINKICRKDQT